ncbi:MAG: glycosyltransferase family A protein [Bacteroidia bacterium]
MKKSTSEKIIFQSPAPTPFFSVIIPTHNRSGLLVRALKSLLSQTEKNWEAIIIDDESTDDTEKIILPYLKKHSQLKYIQQKKQGAAIAKNKGISAASGKFITFLDSDDEYEPNHLASRMKILQQNSSLQFLHGGLKIIGNEFVPDRLNPTNKIHLSECVVGGTFFVERNLLLELNGFQNILLGEDADLFNRIKDMGAITQLTNKATYVYHHETEDSVTNTFMA